MKRSYPHPDVVELRKKHLRLKKKYKRIKKDRDGLFDLYKDITVVVLEMADKLEPLMKRVEEIVGEEEES